jgi:hypothetical protein
MLIAIRDVYPTVRHAGIPKLRNMLKSYLPTDRVQIFLVLCVMEIEAWFLAEHTHISRIHKGITLDRIRDELGFDPSVDDMQMRARPSNDLSNVYWLEKIPYDKSKANVENTLKALDFSRMRFRLIRKFGDLKTLVASFDHLFSSRERS